MSLGTVANRITVPTYKRGDLVWWWSAIRTRDRAEKAVFVRYDKDFPKRDAILATKIGTYTHSWRWPLKYIEPVG